MSAVVPAPSHRRPEDLDPGELDFRESFLQTRLVVGFVGVLLPVVVIGGDLLSVGAVDFRPALSDYYYGPMRDWFVGSLCAIGAGLFVYMANRENQLDNLISDAAGVCAIGVALLPTNPIEQEPTLVADLHLGLAAVLVVLLAVMSIRFGLRDGEKAGRSHAQQLRWRRFHIGCGVAILAAGVAMLASHGLGIGTRYAPLVGESLVVFTFGLSWLAKGAELFALRKLTHDRWYWRLLVWFRRAGSPQARD